MSTCLVRFLLAAAVMIMLPHAAMAQAPEGSQLENCPPVQAPARQSGERSTGQEAARAVPEERSADQRLLPQDGRPASPGTQGEGAQTTSEADCPRPLEHAAKP